MLSQTHGPPTAQKLNEKYRASRFSEHSMRQRVSAVGSQGAPAPSATGPRNTLHTGLSRLLDSSKTWVSLCPVQVLFTPPSLDELRVCVCARVHAEGAATCGLQAAELPPSWPWVQTLRGSPFFLSQKITDLHHFKSWFKNPVSPQAHVIIKTLSCLRAKPPFSDLGGLREESAGANGNVDGSYSVSLCGLSSALSVHGQGLGCGQKQNRQKTPHSRPGHELGLSFWVWLSLEACVPVGSQEGAPPPRPTPWLYPTYEAWRNIKDCYII